MVSERILCGALELGTFEPRPSVVQKFGKTNPEVHEDVNGRQSRRPEITTN
jgi:hypothetical protein